MNSSEHIENMEQRTSWEMHKNEKELKLFIQSELTKEEQNEVLQHLCQCDDCAEKYSILMEQHLVHAPMGMKEQIIKKSYSIQNIPEFLKWQFYRYCARVCIGVLTSLFLIFGNARMYQSLSLLQNRSTEYSTNLLNSVNEHLKQMNEFFYENGGMKNDTEKR